MSHTPGPWNVDEKHVIGQRWIFGRSATYCIANVIDINGQRENEANARLIAAAPDMKAVLDEIEECFDRDIYPEQKKEDFDAPDDREYSVTITAKQWRALTRALNKAESRGAMEAPLKTPPAIPEVPS